MFGFMSHESIKYFDNVEIKTKKDFNIPDVYYGLYKNIIAISQFNHEAHIFCNTDKSFYLKLLVHFVGDLHQPLHIGRYEDRGANRIYVKWFGRNSNLHRVWDSEMINSHNMSYSELALNLPNPDFLLFTEEANDFKRGDVLNWVDEIHEYTNKIYADVSIDDKLGYEYQYKNFGTVKDLLLIGGIRLAKILNYLFD